MKKYLILILFTLCFIPKGSAQSVTVDATIDSLQIMIGEQTAINLQVSMDANQHAVFPAYIDTLIRGVEIIDVQKPDTQYLNDKRRMLITQSYIVTSFDSALYYLPPMQVEVDNQTYASNPLALKVYSYSIPLDSLNPDYFFGQKANMKPDFVIGDWIGLIICAFLVIPTLILLIYLCKRFSYNKPIIRKVNFQPNVPPHQAAKSAIEKIKNEKVWKTGDPKAYYTQLTDVIRTYIRDRFGFNALEMTSAEILDQLNKETDKDALKDLKDLLLTADLVKFAKHNPMINENDANLVNAIDFIDETKNPEDENKTPQPTEITIIEKRSLRAKILLIAGIVVVGAALAFSVIFVCVQLYHLFS